MPFGRLSILVRENPAVAAATDGTVLLERHMEGRPGYAECRARTSGFFPLPPGRVRHG